MIRNLSKSPRLIVIYILTIIISGTILTWLSLNNISNFQELTEKRITEEQKLIIENYSREFQSILEYHSEQIEAIIQEDSLPHRNGSFNSGNLLIRNSFKMNSNGAFIRPRFVQTGYDLNPKKSSNSFLSSYTYAERLEFTSKNYSEAEKQYRVALKKSNSYSDTAMIYNALARLFVKNGKPNDAVGLYGKIVSDYGSAFNEPGFPYSYIAVTQLINLRKNRVSEIENILLAFLNALVDNNIPWNDFTGNIVEEINNISDSNGNRSREIQSLCQRVTDVLIDCDNFKNQMQAALKKQNLLFPRLNDFYLVLPENDGNEIMLLTSNKSIATGFIFDLATIDSVVKTNIDKAEYNFGYKVNLINADLNNLSFQDELIEQSNFTPYFNHKLIEVSLKDSKIVDDYIFRRKILTVIGLVLLLGAMMIGLYTLIRDVKSRRKMEKLRSDFVSNVTHELKTPLTSINMFADSILLGTVRSEKNIKKYANVIVKESERLKRMINNILDFSRKENDKLNYNFKTCELSIIIEEIMEEMNYWLEINHFEVSLDIDKNVNADVDPEGLKQVISNLISNAIKYSSTTRKLIIRLFENETGAIIEVEDFGDGISKEEQKKIFEKFYRIQTRDNETVSGTGLGLTVSKDIVEAMGGKILVQSDLGKGSKFSVHLKS